MVCECVNLSDCLCNFEFEPSVVDMLSKALSSIPGEEWNISWIGNTVPQVAAKWVPRNEIPMGTTIWMAAANRSSTPNAGATGATSMEMYTAEDPLEMCTLRMQTESRGVCSVCEQQASGKHYGAITCDGCKGFFRRSIRKKSDFMCRFSNNCQITQKKRNQCRHCRLKKCLLVGMKISAVQTERDRIKYEPPRKDLPPRTRFSAKNLLRIDNSARVPRPQNPGPIVNVSQIFESIKLQLPDFVKWAKLMPMFAELPPSDQVILLRENAGEHLLLNLAHRSLHLGGILLLRNNFVVIKSYETLTLDAALPSAGTNGSIGAAASILVANVFEKLLKPLEELNVDDTEIACLKAILFFQPGAAGLSSVSRVRALQHEIQTNLEDYLYNRKHDGRGRFGSMLLLSPVLKSLSQMMMTQIEHLQIFGEPIENLLQKIMVRD